MIRYKSNKQALIVAILLVLLCLANLTGATLALFTNDPNDGTIGIVTAAGKFDVDIVDADGESLLTKSLALMTTSGTKDCEEVYFEPGAVFFTQTFRVKNDGNIPINYKISLSKNTVVNLEEFEKAFELKIVEENGNLADAQGFSEFKDSLAPNTIGKSYRLYIKMKEDANNDFQGREYTGIGITVYATQGNVDVERK